MNSLMVMLSVGLLSSCLNAAPEKKANPVSKTSETKPVGSKASEILKKDEDCDDKAKKPVEIKPETISLSGNTGCSLDEMKKP